MGYISAMNCLDKKHGATDVFGDKYNELTWKSRANVFKQLQVNGTSVFST